MVKKKIILFALIPLIFLMVPLGAKATPAANFYSAGLTYQSESELCNIHGRITTVIAESDKQGMAGIEQDIFIETEGERLTLEIINWFYGDDILQVGYVLYGSKTGYIQSNRVKAELRTAYKYDILTKPSGFHIDIFDGANVRVSDFYYCEKPRIVETLSYIEYWRYEGEGSFFYYGYVTIDNPQFLSYHQDTDFYYKKKGCPFGFYFIHHVWDGNYFDKGEIDDR